MRLLKVKILAIVAAALAVSALPQKVSAQEVADSLGVATSAVVADDNEVAVADTIATQAEAQQLTEAVSQKAQKKEEKKSRKNMDL